MKHSCIPFEQTHQFSAMFLDYINKSPNLLPFYHRFPTIENFQLQIEEKQFSLAQRQLLHQALSSQYAKIKKSPPTLDLLLEPNTFTITTGHQLNIFTGPLYFIYKIITTINLAKELKNKYPHYQFVPVYWAATEDHDFEEIKSFRLFGKKYTWQHPHPQGAVGRLSLEGLQEILTQNHDLPELFKTAYTQHHNLTDATRYIVNELFGKYGLIVIDADDALLKHSFKQVIKDDLFESPTVDIVNQTNHQLSNLGYKTQIFARPINLFYLDNYVRERIEKKENYFVRINTNEIISKEKIAELAENHPEYFSPNVVLRPLYQEMILPNLAYIGGPAEIIYWLQLKNVFTHFSIPFPLLVPRNFALIIPNLITSKINKLKITHPQLFLSTQQLQTEFVNFVHQTEDSIHEEKEKITEAFEKITQKITQVDSTLYHYIRAEYHRIEKRILHIENKLTKAKKKKHQLDLEQIEIIKNQLFPNESLQERSDNFLNFYMKDTMFIEHLLHILQPLNFQFNIIEYQKTE